MYPALADDVVGIPEAEEQFTIFAGEALRQVGETTPEDRRRHGMLSLRQNVYNAIREALGKFEGKRREREGGSLPGAGKLGR